MLNSRFVLALLEQRDKNEIIGAAGYSIVHRVQLMITLIKMVLLDSV